MYVTTNSSLVWKRVADENMQSARAFARSTIFLLAVLLGTGAYAYSTHARYEGLCTAVEIKARNASEAEARMLGESIAQSYCS